MRHKWRALLLATLSTAYAGDVHTLSRVIFLPDSPVVLAVDEGVHDGSGFPFVEFTVLNTRTGKTLWHAAQHPHTEGDVAPLRDKWFNIYYSNMQSSFGFGPAVPSRPRYQLPAPDVIPASMWGQNKVNVRLWSKPVPIEIKQAPSGEKCPDYVYWKPQSYALYVGGKKLAAGRHHCAVGYSLSRVDIKGNRALIALNAFTAGFEGPDNEQVLVAATLR